MSTKLTIAIDSLAADIKPEVTLIEASPETTRGHYADYMALLSAVEVGAVRTLVGLALVKAGANQRGVRDALSLI